MHRSPLSLAIATTLLTSLANAGHLEEVLVHGDAQRVVLDKSNLTVAMPDTAELMQRIPGGDVNKNGALSGIPQYRGLYGARIHVQADGTAISPGGPNWMDPPLHYTPAALLDSFTVYRGIAPVSAGQETLGGAIDAKTWQGEFAEGDNWQNSGRLYSGAQSNNDGWVTALSSAIANHQHKLRAALLREQADDAEAAEATLVPTEYDRLRYDLGYSLKLGAHQLSLNSSRSETDNSGTPALPMDILYIDGDHHQLGWQFESGNWQAEARLATGNIEHGMTNYHLRQAPMMASMWRRNDTGSDTRSAHVSVTHSDAGLSWTVGLDHQQSIHNSDISNPNNAMFYAVNFNDVERELSGVFAETSIDSGRAQLDLGLRLTRADSDADTVNSSMAMMNPTVAALRDSFNSSQRSQRDELIDAVIKLSYPLDNSTTLYTGVARKSRAPAYQERYLWLPMQATAGLADGNNHVGDPNLQPEVAHELELGIDISSASLWLSPRLFYKEIDDYIQGTPSSDMAVVMISTMMGGDTTPLQFSNTSARLYGADLEASWRFADHWTAEAVAGAVRGERRDIDDALYRIAAPTLTLGLRYQRQTWNLAVLNRLVHAQHKVSATNEEQSTAGYGLLSVHGSYQIAANTTLALGINNLLDKHYRDHLAGYNRAVNPDIAIGERLPGSGRDIFARLRYEW